MSATEIATHRRISHSRHRLEDFIALAGLRIPVGVRLELRRQLVTHRLHPSDSDEGRSELEACLLIGEFSFAAQGDQWHVSKVYAFSTLRGDASAAEVDREVANDRLEADLVRLHQAGVKIARGRLRF